MTLSYMLIVANTIYYGTIKWEMLEYNSERWSHHNMVHPHLYNNTHLVNGVASPTNNKELIKC